MSGWQWLAVAGIVGLIVAAGVAGIRSFIALHTDDLEVDDVAAGKLKPDGAVKVAEELTPTGVFRTRAEVRREYASDLPATEVREFYANELGRPPWTATGAERAGCDAWALHRLTIEVCDESGTGSPGFSVTTILEANPEERP